MGTLAAVAVVVAAGFGYAAVAADNQTYTGCLDPGGAISNVKIGSTPLKPCPKSSQQISWSQTGPAGTNGTNGTNGNDGTDGTDGTNGTDGVSVTSETEPAGANCANGGSKFTADDDNVTYACNGQNGEDGQDGTGTSLVGSPCSLPDDTAGTVQMSVAANGAISFVCQTAGGPDLCADLPSYPNSTTHCNPETGTLSITCSTGFANGDNEITNGCEINLLTDPANCGVVGRVVPSLPNATAGCVNGDYAILGCNAGFYNLDGEVGNGCEVNIMTDPNNCGGVGNHGSSPTVATYSCVAGQLQIAACKGENYDVNNAVGDGCERFQSFQAHDQNTAFSLGSKSCFDASGDTIVSGTLYSDSQTHVPFIPAFNSTTGSAPAWYRVFADGGFACLNDYEVTFTTSGGSAAACYRLTLQTNNLTDTVTASGSGSATMSGGSGSYSTDTFITFKVEKTCSLPVQEAINYTIQFHL